MTRDHKLNKFDFSNDNDNPVTYFVAASIVFRYEVPHLPIKLYNCIILIINYYY